MTYTGFPHRALALILGFIFIAFILITSISFPREVNRTYAGMGDLHRFESQASSPETRLLGETPIHVGMGDLHRFEAREVGQRTSLANAGMGDLHLTEAGQVLPITGRIQSRQKYAGMGDLRALEALQSK